MKTLYTAFCLFVLTAVTSAQVSLTVSDHVPDVYVPADPTTFILNYYNHVNNITQTDIIARVERTLITRTPGHNTAVCWGPTCTFDTTNTVTVLSTFDTVPAMDYNATLKGQLYPQGNAGMTQVKYCFFDTLNMADSACVTVTFDLFVGFEEFKTVKGIVGNPFPNPSNTVTSFGYDLSADLKSRQVNVYNATGSMIHTETLEFANGVYRLQSSELAEGIYFCNFIGDGEVIATRKFIVR